MLVPWPTPEGRDDLDQFWHQHILDTPKYAADCNRLFGRMIHHNPHVVRGSDQESYAVLKTQRLYARTLARHHTASASMGVPWRVAAPALPPIAAVHAIAVTWAAGAAIVVTAAVVTGADMDVEAAAAATSVELLNFRPPGQTA